MSVKEKNPPVINQLSATTEADDFASEKPLLIIESGGNSLNLLDLWRYRDLLFILTWRDIKVRYKQTALGVLWAIIQPLFLMAVFTLIFGKLAAMPSDGVPYLLFALAGLVPWTFFANSVVTSGNSLVGNSALITKVYFPRMIIPLAAIGAGLVDLTISFVLLVGVMIFYGIGFSLNFLLLPLLLLLLILLTAGIGMWMSAINVKYRDVRHALPFLLQIWLFATPIIYPASLLPENWRWLLMINPLTGIIETYRAVLFDKPPEWKFLGFSVVFILIFFIYSVFSFRKMERGFADIV
jgi:lipopolysaccharide transport system permease protein